jgi:ribosomal-protein-alanine N-acetyltransferase
MNGPESILIRRIATDAELEAVVDLEARCFTNPWTREMLVRELRQSDVAHVFVLRLADETVAAFCSCWIVADELHINTIAVDHAHRRQGLGTELLRHVLADAAARGVVRATLEVRASNEPARLLYERLGFTLSAIRSRYYTQPEDDALILWKERLID